MQNSHLRDFPRGLENIGCILCRKVAFRGIFFKDNLSAGSVVCLFFVSFVIHFRLLRLRLNTPSTKPKGLTKWKPQTLKKNRNSARCFFLKVLFTLNTPLKKLANSWFTYKMFVAFQVGFISSFSSWWFQPL